MKFSEIVTQASALLQRKGRITYRALQREFNLDEAALADLKDELIEGEQIARDENGKVLVWIGASPVSGSTFQVPGSSQLPTAQTGDAGLRTPDCGRRTLNPRRKTLDGMRLSAAS
ncbi:MAG: hypothetical protein HY268_20200 [Deltaproteobacteria bacterium]|nr:hypothetical protein [Deltaproteobacteria bacterium]